MLEIMSYAIIAIIFHGFLSYVGNILSLIVINKSELHLKISFRTMISQLCVLDMITIVFNILMFTIHFHSEFYRLQVCKFKLEVPDHSKYFLFSAQILPLMLPVLLTLTNMALTASVYTTLAVAVERFMSVRR